MGCTTFREKIESNMLQMKLARSTIQEKREELLAQMKKNGINDPAIINRPPIIDYIDPDELGYEQVTGQPNNANNDSQTIPEGLPAPIYPKPLPQVNSQKKPQEPIKNQKESDDEEEEEEEDELTRKNQKGKK